LKYLFCYYQANLKWPHVYIWGLFMEIRSTVWPPSIPADTTEAEWNRPNRDEGSRWRRLYAHVTPTGNPPFWNYLARILVVELNRNFKFLRFVDIARLFNRLIFYSRQGVNNATFKNSKLSFLVPWYLRNVHKGSLEPEAFKLQMSIGCPTRTLEYYSQSTFEQWLNT